jgi:hypothetical protein
MGNSNQFPNTAFKQFRKEGFSGKPPKISPHSTFFDEAELLERLYRVCIDHLRISSSEIDDKPLLASNEQENKEHIDDDARLHQARKSLA